MTHRYVLGLLSVLARPALGQSGHPECAVLDIRMITPDSMAAQITQPRCGALRLVIEGAPRLIPDPPGIYQPTRRFQLAVALVNTSHANLPAPVRVKVDSAVPIQRGKQLNAHYLRDYAGFEFWDGRRMQQPWEFSAVSGKAGVLRPGERSVTRLLKLGIQPLTQGVRVWFEIEGQLPEPPYAPPAGVDQPARDTLPLGAAVERFIAAAGFPELRSKSAIYRDPSRDLVIFEVSYGKPQDCPAGCFYSGAAGLKYGSRIGWLEHDDYERDDSVKARVRGRMFRSEDLDEYLLSEKFDTRLRTRLGRYSPMADQVILPLVLRNPQVPRRRLLHYVESLYGDVQQWLANLLVGIPKVQQDADLLTLLANLPRAGGPPYASTAGVARDRLREMAPVLLRDPHLSTRTLFVLAVELPRFIAVGESGPRLLPELIAHPKVRSNPAMLAVLWQFRPEIGPQLLASIDASDSAKKVLSRYLVRGQRPDTAVARTLLDDPVAGSNLDVLTVLANTDMGDNYEIMMAATRRLPEQALKSREGPTVPLH
ncbi:MAG: hypothetical protein ACJ8BF_08860 [Gemmatimonadales bacterium]